jgi:hypothetical protein
MAELEKLQHSPIEPIYRQERPNEAIELGSWGVEFQHDGATRRGNAALTLRFVPDNRFEVFVPTDVLTQRFMWTFGLIGSGSKTFALVDRGVSFDAFCTAAGDDRGGAIFTPSRSLMVATQPSSSLMSAVFHLFNFPAFYATEDYVLMHGETLREGATRCGRAVLKADGWRISIAATSRTRELCKALESQGGYVITHVGRIEREDGAAFTSESLEGLLGGFHHFLSFALGRWAGLALTVGFDADGGRCYEEWGLRQTADGEWRGASSWLDRHHAEVLSETFPGFMALWTNSLWNQPLRHTLYWYMGACDRRIGIGTDTGLIIAQAALEVLAWTHCVLDKKLASRKEFKPGGLSAAGKLRLLLTSLGVPLAIPAHFSGLQGAGRGKWKDGADAIAGIRNSLVHPDSPTTFGGQAYYEAWRLSLWYIDMVLLRLCGHTGSYSNRLASQRSVGQVEQVPWSPPT